MIGPGLSLMGGALAQNEAGVGETVYFLSSCARNKAAFIQPVNYVSNDIKKAWADEEIWFSFTVVPSIAANNSVAGGGAINVRLENGGYVAGHYALKNTGSGPALHCFYWHPNVRLIPFNQGYPNTIRLTYSFKGGQYHWLGDGAFDFMGKVTTSDEGSDLTSRNITLNNVVSECYGLSYHSARGGVSVLYAPMADRKGSYAIWDSYSKTLVEL